jgi:hypothetical protein
VERTETSSSEEEEEGDDKVNDEDERESHNSEKADSTETRDSSPAPFFKLKKGGGLFRGTKQEKVCQICEKPGDTVKCRGPCCATFHLECMSKSLANKENESTTPGSARVKKSKTVLSASLNESNVNDSSFETKAEEDAQTRELTEGSEVEDGYPKPANGVSNMTEHDDLSNGKECVRMSRKRKRSGPEEEMCVANKKDAKANAVHGAATDENRVKDGETDDEKISEENEEDRIVQRKENEELCKENVDSTVKQKVELETVEEVRRDVDKVDDMTEMEAETETKGNGKETSDADEIEINEDGSEGMTIKKENSADESSVEVVSGEEKDVMMDHIVSDGNKDEKGTEGGSDKENKELSKDGEKSVIAKNGNRENSGRKDEQAGAEFDWDESKNGVKGTLVSGEKDRYRRATRGMSKRREREDGKGSRTDVKEVKKETKISPDEKDKERNVPKKRDKEEKGKDDAAEEKMAADSAAEFRCRDCREGRNPPCFACGRIQEEKSGREHRQRCAVGKHFKSSQCHCS